MPVRFSYPHGNRRSRVRVDEIDDLGRLSSMEAPGNDDEDQFLAGSDHRFTCPSQEDGGVGQGNLSSKGPVSCVQTPLSSSSYSEFDLLHHLHHISKHNTEVVLVLGDVYRQRNELTTATLFSFESNLDASIPSASDDSPSCETYDVGRNGLVTVQESRQTDDYDGASESSIIWDLIKDMNLDDNAVGRITILHQPSSITFAGIHLTMEDHFDMDDLISRIVSDKRASKGKTASYVREISEHRPFHRGPFLFVFKYYTIVDEGFSPAQWQRYSCISSDRETTDSVEISECSSIIALSLEKNRFGQTVQEDGEEAEDHHFAPFHVLNIRCFPDNLRSTHNFGGQPCYSGPFAFIQCLDSEYKNAARRFSRLNERIAALALPSTDFIFDIHLRDQLLFEDADYTFSRRYFWAFNCLAMINESIRSMINAYTGTFSDKFWLGQDPTLWPHSNPESAEGRNYLKQLDRLRHGLERSMVDLRSLIKSNDQLRQQIESLREQLYSGSSVKENRMAIEQGENIKILTGVSMLFLPLSFVTSVFGMQMFTIAPSDWRFVVTMIAVCVPFFILIFVLQTNAGMSLYQRIRLSIKACHEKWKQRAASRRKQRAQLQQAEMMRRQSCATTVVAGKRESIWNFDSNGAQGMAAHALDERQGGRPWWEWSRKKSKEPAVSRKDSNV